MDEEKYVCDLCKLNFSTEQELKEHDWSLLHHRKLDKEKGRDAIHTCMLCKEDLFGLLAFTKHIHSEKHTNEATKLKYSESKETSHLSTPLQQTCDASNISMQRPNVGTLPLPAAHFLPRARYFQSLENPLASTPLIDPSTKNFQTRRPWKLHRFTPQHRPYVPPSSNFRPRFQNQYKYNRPGYSPAYLNLPNNKGNLNTSPSATDNTFFNMVSNTSYRDQTNINCYPRPLQMQTNFRNTLGMKYPKETSSNYSNTLNTSTTCSNLTSTNNTDIHTMINNVMATSPIIPLNDMSADNSDQRHNIKNKYPKSTEEIHSNLLQSSTCNQYPSPKSINKNTQFTPSKGITVTNALSTSLSKKQRHDLNHSTRKHDPRYKPRKRSIDKVSSLKRLSGRNYSKTFDSKSSINSTADEHNLSISFRANKKLSYVKTKELLAKTKLCKQGSLKKTTRNKNMKPDNLNLNVQFVLRKGREIVKRYNKGINKGNIKNNQITRRNDQGRLSTVSNVSKILNTKDHAMNNSSPIDFTNITDLYKVSKPTNFGKIDFDMKRNENFSEDIGGTPVSEKVQILLQQVKPVRVELSALSPTTLGSIKKSRRRDCGPQWSKTFDTVAPHGKKPKMKSLRNKIEVMREQSDGEKKYLDKNATTSNSEFSLSMDSVNSLCSLPSPRASTPSLFNDKCIQETLQVPPLANTVHGRNLGSLLDSSAEFVDIHGSTNTEEINDSHNLLMKSTGLNLSKEKMEKRSISGEMKCLKKAFNHSMLGKEKTEELLKEFELYQRQREISKENTAPEENLKCGTSNGFFSLTGDIVPLDNVNTKCGRDNEHSITPMQKCVPIVVVINTCENNEESNASTKKAGCIENIKAGDAQKSNKTVDVKKIDKQDSSCNIVRSLPVESTGISKEVDCSNNVDGLPHLPTEKRVEASIVKQRFRRISTSCSFSNLSVALQDANDALESSEVDDTSCSTSKDEQPMSSQLLRSLSESDVIQATGDSFQKILTNYVYNCDVELPDGPTDSDMILPPVSCNIEEKPTAEHCCEFKKNNGSYCDTHTIHRFCDYHDRVLKAVELFVSKKVAAGSSQVADAVSLIAVEESDGEALSTISSSKRRLSETLRRSHKKSKSVCTQSETANELSIPQVATTTSLNISKVRKQARFKYLRSLSTSQSNEVHKSNLPPTVRKLLDKKYNNGHTIGPNVPMLSSSQSESESEIIICEEKKGRENISNQLKESLYTTDKSTPSDNESCFSGNVVVSSLYDSDISDLSLLDRMQECIPPICGDSGSIMDIIHTTVVPGHNILERLFSIQAPVFTKALTPTVTCNVESASQLSLKSNEGVNDVSAGDKASARQEDLSLIHSQSAAVNVIVASATHSTTTTTVTTANLMTSGTAGVISGSTNKSTNDSIASLQIMVSESNVIHTGMKSLYTNVIMSPSASLTPSTCVSSVSSITPISITNSIGMVPSISSTSFPISVITIPDDRPPFSSLSSTVSGNANESLAKQMFHSTSVICSSITPSVIVNDNTSLCKSVKEGTNIPICITNTEVTCSGSDFEKHEGDFIKLINKTSLEGDTNNKNSTDMGTASYGITVMSSSTDSLDSETLTTLFGIKGPIVSSIRDSGSCMPTYVYSSISCVDALACSVIIDPMTVSSGCLADSLLSISSCHTSHTFSKISSDASNKTSNNVIACPDGSISTVFTEPVKNNPLTVNNIVEIGNNISSSDCREDSNECVTKVIFTTPKAMQSTLIESKDNESSLFVDNSIQFNKELSCIDKNDTAHFHSIDSKLNCNNYTDEETYGTCNASDDEGSYEALDGCSKDASSTFETFKSFEFDDLSPTKNGLKMSVIQIENHLDTANVIRCIPTVSGIGSFMEETDNISGPSEIVELEREMNRLQADEDDSLDKLSKANKSLERLKIEMGKLQDEISLHANHMQKISAQKKKLRIQLRECRLSKETSLFTTALRKCINKNDNSSNKCLHRKTFKNSMSLCAEDTSSDDNIPLSILLKEKRTLQTISNHNAVPSVDSVDIMTKDYANDGALSPKENSSCSNSSCDNISCISELASEYDTAPNSLNKYENSGVRRRSKSVDGTPKSNMTNTSVKRSKGYRDNSRRLRSRPKKCNNGK